MTLEDLKKRCEALAAVGDEQAKCTLEYLFSPGRTENELAALRQKNQELAAANVKLHNENATLKNDKPAAKYDDAKVANALYILGKLKTTMSLVEALGVGAMLPKFGIEVAESVRPPVVNQNAQYKPDQFQGVTHKGEVIDGVEPRPRAQVPPPRRSADAHLREDKPEEGASAEEAASINALAREYGIPQDGPEAAAIAATRAAHGLPAATEPLAAAANPLMKTGGFEKVPGAEKDGNKE